MVRTLLKSKIHMATVTEANFEYYGSISIDEALCEAANLVPFEKVEIYNCNNGARFATYVILGKKGQICLNGAAARHVATKDTVIIASYAQIEEAQLKTHNPYLIFVDKKNRIAQKRRYFDASINDPQYS